jgi:hypothetical protein
MHKLPIKENAGFAIIYFAEHGFLHKAPNFQQSV